MTEKMEQFVQTALATAWADARRAERRSVFAPVNFGAGVFSLWSVYGYPKGKRKYILRAVRAGLPMAKGPEYAYPALLKCCEKL